MTQSDEEISKWLLAVFVFYLDERIFKIDRARGRSWAGLGCRGAGLHTYWSTVVASLH
jgi:hypothetical protein